MNKHEELIERLRASYEIGIDPADAIDAAATALEAQAREIEGLRKQDDELILRLVEALENYPSGRSQAAAAGRARLEGKP